MSDDGSKDQLQIGLGPKKEKIGRGCTEQSDETLSHSRSEHFHDRQRQMSTTVLEVGQYGVAGEWKRR